MKRLISSIIAYSVMAMAAFSLSGQDKDHDWKERMMNEKIAFFTTEIGLTPAEGQAFWPVYNQVNEERDKAMREIFRTYKALSQAVEDGKGAKEVEKLLDEYLNAQQKQRDIDSKAAGKYEKVLPIEKVAKVYLAEERFRRQQIHRLHRGGSQKNQR